MHPKTRWKTCFEKTSGIVVINRNSWFRSANELSCGLPGSDWSSGIRNSLMAASNCWASLFIASQKWRKVSPICLRAPFSPSLSFWAHVWANMWQLAASCAPSLGVTKKPKNVRNIMECFFQVVRKENDEDPRMRIVQKKSPVESKTCMGLSSKLYLWSAEAIKIWSVDRRGCACVPLQKVQLTVWFLRVAAHSDTRFLKTYVHLCPSNSSCASS